MDSSQSLKSNAEWACRCTAINPQSSSICWNCKQNKSTSEAHNLATPSYQKLTPEEKNVREEEVARVQVVTVEVLPSQAKYRLIGIVSFQSTLGTGLFSEVGSTVSNIFGTESTMINEKMDRSFAKWVSAMKRLAHAKGGNAVIGASFEFTTNSKDATTVAAAGTVVIIENVEEVFFVEALS